MLGYDVATFESTERFLKATCLAETSCLITDLQMPGLSGGSSDEKFRVLAMSAGAVGFLSKPLDESLLISCLESALNPSIVPPLMIEFMTFA